MEASGGRGENRPRVTAGCCGWTCQCPRVGIVVVAAPECQQVLVGARDELVGRVVRASLGEPYGERAVILLGEDGADGHESARMR